MASLRWPVVTAARVVGSGRVVVTGSASPGARWSDRIHVDLRDPTGLHEYEIAIEPVKDSERIHAQLVKSPPYLPDEIERAIIWQAMWHDARHPQGKEWASEDARRDAETTWASINHPDNDVESVRFFHLVNSLYLPGGPLAGLVPTSMSGRCTRAAKQLSVSRSAAIDRYQQGAKVIENSPSPGFPLGIAHQVATAITEITGLVTDAGTVHRILTNDMK